MQKAAIGILVLLLLFLAAVNARLEQRIEFLERRPAPPPPRPCNRPHAPPPTAAAAAVPAAPEAPPPTPEKRHPVVATTTNQKYVDLAIGKFYVETLMRTPDADLGLSEEQKGIIESLRKSCDAQTKPSRDEIQAIEKRTEEDIRRQLTPEQLAKYEAGKILDFIEDRSLRIVEPAGLVRLDEPKPAYLGVQGGDAPGGGVALHEVFPDSAAAGIGLQRDDVLLELDGEKLATYGNLTTRIAGSSPGAFVTLKIRRGGTEFLQGVQLGPRP